MKHLYAFVTHIVDADFDENDKNEIVTMKYERFYSKCKKGQPQKYPWSESWPPELIKAVKESFKRVCLPDKGKSPYDFFEKSVEYVEDVPVEDLLAIVADFLYDKIQEVLGEGFWQYNINDLKDQAHLLYLSTTDRSTCAILKDWLQLFNFKVREKSAEALANVLVSHIVSPFTGDTIPVEKSAKACIAYFLLMKGNGNAMLESSAGTKSKIELPCIDNCI